MEWRLPGIFCKRFKFPRVGDDNVREGKMYGLKAGGNLSEGAGWKAGCLAGWLDGWRELVEGG